MGALEIVLYCSYTNGKLRKKCSKSCWLLSSMYSTIHGRWPKLLFSPWWKLMKRPELCSPNKILQESAVQSFDGNPHIYRSARNPEVPAESDRIGCAEVPHVEGGLKTASSSRTGAMSTWQLLAISSCFQGGCRTLPPYLQGIRTSLHDMFFGRSHSSK